MKSKTAYFIIGDDPEEAFNWAFTPKDLKEIKDQGYEIQFIRPTPGQTFKEATKSIEPGSSVYLGVHKYSDGTFLWNAGERIDTARSTHIPSIVVEIESNKPIPELDKTDLPYKNSVETPFEVRSNAGVTKGMFTYEDSQAMEHAIAKWHQEHPGKHYADMSQQEKDDSRHQADLALDIQLLREVKLSQSQFDAIHEVTRNSDREGAGQHLDHNLKPLHTPTLLESAYLKR
jgi:hypothetical protein